MTKAEIIDAVYEKVGGFSKKEAAEIVEAVFDTMKEVLADGEKIKISGFGNFVVRQKKERIGRNPQTGAPIPISARRVLTFKPSQVLKGILNPHKEQLKAAAAKEAGLLPEGEAAGAADASAGGTNEDDATP
ncbi:MAG: integration host factor subunit alpha [Sandaracinus sp.]|nr:integration host factor subunit alpha [Myxococcales bacterium]MAT25733.1 integration host factor subunit alpha [Sandaracinus sp.]MBJ71666.1 integration host factor subunit alpha [Sandaracinus sp.]